MEKDKVFSDLKNAKETMWINDSLTAVDPYFELNGKKFVHIKAAQNRLMRFMPYIERVFKETADRKGIIESKLIEIAGMREIMTGKDAVVRNAYKAGGSDFKKQENVRGTLIRGRLLLKDDAHLPIAGSVKARGGIHEVLKVAEQLALKNNLLKVTDDYSIIDSDEFRELFSKYTIQVGSTGNLGLSIGIMSAKLGFKVKVHMSADAKAWKKELLKAYGVDVIEYESDYSKAVAEGRRQSEIDPMSHFVDDEASEDLFMGYATAALRLRVQLNKLGILVDDEHPLFVYLPCGVGGAPGGITYGLKQLMGKNVHCFFAEPVNAPCFTLGMVTGKHGAITVGDIGLDGRTIADGLAVGRVSAFVCSMMEELVSGSYTIYDERLLKYQKLLFDTEGIFLEPSACAGFLGPELICACAESMLVGNNNCGELSKIGAYIKKYNLAHKLDNATHVVWATGGGLVPENLRFS